MNWSEIRRQIMSLVVVALVTTVARASFADHYGVPSGSMEPSVHVGDRVFVNKLAYGLRVPLTDRYVVRFQGPKAGDVVVLDAPDEDMVLLKRVVAGPGDVVAVRSGALELNGRSVAIAKQGGEVYELLGSPPHLLDLDAGGGPSFGPVRVPEGKYLVLGDNRGNSRDGRFFGFVDRGAILGRAAAIYWRGGWFEFRPL
jgi:signal peptidase I